MSDLPLLEIKKLNVYYKIEGGIVRAVDDVSFKVYKNEIFGIVGESGCGKSTLSLGILNLVKPPCYINSGEVLFKGKNIFELNDEKLRQLRLDQATYIPQSSMSALNPVMKIKDQIVDGIRAHKKLDDEAVENTVKNLLTMVGLSPEIANMYPHELSGGMKQRVTICAALALKPELIICDEPTTALDVVVQRAVLEFLVDFKKSAESTIMVITHDIAVQAEICDRIAVMYAGKIVEIGDVNDIFEAPMHPYTKALIDSTPSLNRKRELIGLAGSPPSLVNPPLGCRFASRCNRAMSVCFKEEPILSEIEPERYLACHLYYNGE